MLLYFFFCQNAVPVFGVPGCDLVLVLLAGELLLQLLKVLGVGLQGGDVGLEDAVEVVGHGGVRRELERHEGRTEVGEVGGTVVASVTGGVAVGREAREAETGAAESSAAETASAGEGASVAAREGATADGVAVGVVGHSLVVDLPRASLLTR